MIDSEKFEQMELDTRPQLVAAIEDLTSSSIRDAQGMIEENRRRIAAMMQTTPATVRNRHEAYGIAAEQYARIAKAVSSIKGDTATLLGTLADPNFPAVEATSSIVNRGNGPHLGGGGDAPHPGQSLHGGNGGERSAHPPGGIGGSAQLPGSRGRR